MKPLAYGYMCVTVESDDEQLLRSERLLVQYAEAEGYRLGMIFYDYAPGQLRTFAALMRALQCSEAYHVLTPSRGHLARHPVLQRALIRILEDNADAELIEVGEPE
ncbi:hypothetical protein [Streptacidiphilus sp. P02-A3a]|uniref:hypothetical protein n=1 Tax=Streptacidiphilus sp. P02-A3a TaxID=2704468 RepID=UPI001CDC489A|nr:hypothetical protein [Streptacidiphilus sp. P02-A3a]